jgi:hypothetical protein
VQVQSFHRCLASRTIFETDPISSLPPTPVCIIRFDLYLTPVVEPLFKLTSRCEAERLAFVVFISSPRHEEVLHATQELVVEGCDERLRALAIGDVDSEFGRVTAVGCFVNFAALVVNLLAGQDEVFAW